MKQLIYIAIAASVLACSGENGKEQTEKRQSTAALTENYVDTMTLRRIDFNHQIVCNGILRAKMKSQLEPKHSEVITDIKVGTGDRVAKGQLLAVTEESQYIRALDKARRELEKAEIEYADKLITLGFDITDSIPEETHKRAEVTSGLFSARHELMEAEQNLADCRLYAPFAGRIADLEGKLYQKADKFCTLLDESAYEVEFNVLEAELSSVSVGNEVKAAPFVGEKTSHTGRIVSINPSVSDKGLVKVTACIPTSKDLLDGMNVKVIVQRTEPGLLVVPKDAVVERDGYDVVFIYRDGQAIWTYVDITSSNLTHHAITGCERKHTVINPGDIIITSGNMNLANGTAVKPRGK